MGEAVTIPRYTEEVKWRVAPLEIIVATMAAQQQLWYDKTVGMLRGFPADGIIFSKHIFMLAYCFDRVYGTMSWGNWLRLPVEFMQSDQLDDSQMMLASEQGDVAMLDIGVMIAQMEPNVLPLRQFSV